MYLKVLSEWLRLYLDPYEPIFKLVSFVIGPVVAIIAFCLNLRTRRELITKGEELGAARAASERAREAASQKQQEVDRTRAALEARGAEVAKLEKNLRDITEGSEDLWRLRPPRPFATYLSWIRDPAGAKLITIGNLKGGVGKTTLAANLAAFISETQKKPVLVVDL